MIHTNSAAGKSISISLYPATEKTAEYIVERKRVEKKAWRAAIYKEIRVYECVHILPYIIIKRTKKIKTVGESVEKV